MWDWPQLDEKLNEITVDLALLKSQLSIVQARLFALEVPPPPPPPPPPPVDPPTPPVPPPPPPTTGTTYTSSVTLRSDAQYVGDVFARSTLDTGSYGLVGSGVSDALIESCRFENLDRCIKVGSGSLSKRITIKDALMENVYQGIFFANVHGATIENVVIHAADKPGTKNHCLYLEKDVEAVHIRGLMLTGGLGQSIHCYMDSGTWGEDILIEQVEVWNENHGAVVIQNYRGVTVRHGVLRAAPSEPAIKLYQGVTGCTFEDLRCYGARLYEAKGNNDGTRFVNCWLNGELQPDVTL